MSRYSDTIRDEFGRAVPGVQVYVYDWDVPSQATGLRTDITDDDLTTPLANPLTSDEFGFFYFNWQSGSILLELHYGGKLQSRELIRENASDLSLRTDLAAVGGSALVTFDKTQTYTAGTVGASLNGLYGTFTGSPNYVGVGSDSTFIVAQGSATTPSTTQGSVTVFQKAGNSLAFNTLTAIAFKHSSAANARATAFFSEATDKVGGILSFVEGARSQATLLSGPNGSAYGGIFVAGTAAAAGGPTTPAYLIGAEAEVDDQIGPDALDYLSFNPNSYKASWVATNGVGPGTRYKIDALWSGNPFSAKSARTGFLVPVGSVDHTVVAGSIGVTLVNGFDLSRAVISGSFAKRPNNIPNTSRNAAGSADLETDRLDTSDILQLGGGTNGVRAKASFGFATGSGGTITQITSKATAVLLNKSSGAITLNNASLAANTIVSFTFNNSQIGADDRVAVWVKSGNASVGSYRVAAEGSASGSRTIVVENKTAGALSEALVLGFEVFKGVTS